MSRKRFFADVEAAAKCPVAYAQDVCLNDDRESFNFSFALPGARRAVMTALATDITSYPNGNTYFVSCSSGLTEDHPACLALLESQESMARLTVTELIAKTADFVRPFTSGTSTNPISLDSDEDEYEAGHDDSASEIDGDDFEVGSDSDDMFANIPEINLKTKLQPQINQAELSGFTREQMRELLRARIGGFRVGAHTKMTAAAPFPVVCISVRIRHLEISEGALLAWDLNPDHYVVMLMRYGHGYRSFKRLVEGAASQTGIQFRLGVCKRYKPSPEDACAAFEDGRIYGIIGDLPEDANTDVTVNGKKTTFEHFFLSEPLKDIMNQKFIALLKIRDTYGVDWDGAIRFLKAREADPDRALLPSDIHQTEAELASGGTSLRTDIPGFIAADEVTDSFKEHASFPLQAMQFAMKYLVSCTKFCLICHDPTDETVEALKPYVCQKPLCLYQYMNHGFGPSIEHEIISRPFVVDLLVSFCFAAASAMQLRSYPDGMGLCMPRNPPPVVLGAPGDQPVASAEHGCYDVYFIDSGIVDTYHISLEHLECSAVVRIGDWVALKAFSELHSKQYKVVDYNHPFMTVTRNGDFDEARLGTFSGRAIPLPSSREPFEGPEKRQTMLITSVDGFDGLLDTEKCQAMVGLMMSMPPILDIRQRLLSPTGSRRLNNWYGLSPTALSLLRWIVSSNRSCIIQVQQIRDQANSFSDVGVMSQDLIPGFPGWLQFRFAMGAPDKEEKFRKALTAQFASGKFPVHPTLFAWHGSPFPNWHSIIRSGLDFSKTLHGRAFGDGCYFSQDFMVSRGYSGISILNRMQQTLAHAGVGFTLSWPGSLIKPISAITLNEIVNAPDKYVSKNPHLVVQHVDWIQPRYMFVEVNSTAIEVAGVNGQDKRPYHVQDPTMPARTLDRQLLNIPAGAVANYDKVNETQSTKRPAKKMKSASGDVMSEASDADDIALLMDDDGDTHMANTQPLLTKTTGATRALMKALMNKSAGDSSAVSTPGLQTPITITSSSSSLSTPSAPPVLGWAPGSVNMATIRLLGEPTYANPAATKILNREIKALTKVMNSTPPHELGWYIDTASLSNMYQWIVEFHSFPMDLPLAQDLRKVGMSSIVLEFRFGADFPVSPPFVRVVRPRFVPFMYGGGGNVTAGGAICMELLTNDAWSPGYAMESVLFQVRLQVMDRERPGRVAAVADYGAEEAIEAYLRACRAHGWKPQDMSGFR